MTKKSFRRYGIVIFILGLLLKPCITYADESVPLRFAVIGDRTGGHDPGVFGSILTEIDRLKPDFIMTVGDMIEGYTENLEEIEKQWQEFKEIVKVTDIPIYYTAGNHDITTDALLPKYKQHIGQPYYSFTVRDTHFIILDTSRWEKSEELPSEQIDWLIKDLKKNKRQEKIFLFFHKPFWYKTLAESKKDKLHDIFVEYGVDAVFTGHFHMYFSDTYDGILYTSVGSSGGGTIERPQGLKYHFCWVTVSDDEISVVPIKKDSILAWDEVTVADQKSIDRIENNGFEYVNPIFLNDDLSVSSSTISIIVHNSNKEKDLVGPLRIELPGPWEINLPVSKTVNDNIILWAAHYPLNVKPGSSQTIDITLSNSGPIYPGPEISTVFPVLENLEYQHKDNIPIARKVACIKASGKPKIDGYLNDLIWRSPVTAFFSSEGKMMTSDPVSFYFAHDDQFLYLGAYCEENDMSKIVQNTDNADGAVYLDDCVGYFFQPDPNIGNIYQIYANARGVIFDQIIVIDEKGDVSNDINWNGQYVVKTVQASDAWSIEIAVPFELFNFTPQSAQQWKLNFRRKQQRLNETANWLYPISYNPKYYGFMIME